MNSKKKFLSLIILLSSAAIYAAQPAKSGVSSKDVKANIAVNDVVVDGMTDLTVRYVNTMEAMQLSKKGQEIQKELETKRDALTKKVKAEEEKMQAAVAEFKSKESTLNKNARSEQEAKIVKMQREYETLVKTCEDELRLAMQQATEELSVQVEKNVYEIAQKNKYDVVADIYTGRTIYVSEKAMVTADLVKALDKTYVAKAPGAKKPATA